LWFGITITRCHGKTFTSGFMMAYLYVHTRSHVYVWERACEVPQKSAVENKINLPAICFLFPSSLIRFDCMWFPHDLYILRNFCKCIPTFIRLQICLCVYLQISLVSIFYFQRALRWGGGLLYQYDYYIIVQGWPTWIYVNEPHG